MTPPADSLLWKGHWLFFGEITQKRCEDLLMDILSLRRKGEFAGGLIGGDGTPSRLRIRGRDFLSLPTPETPFLWEELPVKEVPSSPPPLSSPSTHFSTFYSPQDTRWESLPVPPAPLILAGECRREGLESSLSLLPLEGALPRPPEAEVWGFTLYDDFLPSILPRLKSIRASYPGLLGAGGPLPSLAPLATAVHLPQLNFLYRGEGEGRIGPLLKEMVRWRTLSAEALLERSLSWEGLLFRDKGLFLLASLDKVNLAENLDAPLDFSLLDDRALALGLELNLSRGCIGRCRFCSHVHGRRIRSTSPEALERLLEDHRNELELRKISPTRQALSVNINDDDLPASPKVALPLLKTLSKKGYRVHGLQTSLGALSTGRGTLRRDLFEALSNPGFFLGSPLFWIGTDAFLPRREERLGKRPVPKAFFEELGEMAEDLGVDHYHYWIILDGDSTWDEFWQEFFLLWELSTRFPRFHLLPTSPYLIPYPYTEAYRNRISLPEPRIRLKALLETTPPLLSYPVVEREEPADSLLSLAVDPQRSEALLAALKNQEFFQAFREFFSLWSRSDEYLSGEEGERRGKRFALEERVSSLQGVTSSGGDDGHPLRKG